MGKLIDGLKVGAGQATPYGHRQRRLFLDTEFFTFKGVHRLLSFALVSETGPFIYMELVLGELQAVPSSRLNKFLKEQVLSQFGRVPESALPARDMPARLSDWLGSLNAGTVEVVYDYSVDYLLLEQLLAAMTAPPATRLIPVHVGYALSDPAGQAEAELTWQWVEDCFGIRRHHALADAMALGGRFLAIHGDPPKSGANRGSD